MIMRPRLLLLDEPTAYLDPGQIPNLRHLLEQIEALGTTILMASLDLQFIKDWADWVIVMHGGQVIQENHPQQIFQQLAFLESIGLH